jgi:hypothetical protein
MSAFIRWQCPKCAKKLKASRERIGQMVACAGCRTRMAVPDVSAVPPPNDPVLPLTNNAERVSASRLADTYDENSNEVSPGWFRHHRGLLIGAGTCMVLSVILAASVAKYFIVNDWHRHSQVSASSAPTKITADPRLSAKNPGSSQPARVAAPENQTRVEVPAKSLVPPEPTAAPLVATKPRPAAPERYEYLKPVNPPEPLFKVREEVATIVMKDGSSRRVQLRSNSLFGGADVSFYVGMKFTTIPPEKIKEIQVQDDVYVYGVHEFWQANDVKLVPQNQKGFFRKREVEARNSYLAELNRRFPRENIAGGIHVTLTWESKGIGIIGHGRHQGREVRGMLKQINEDQSLVVETIESGPRETRTYPAGTAKDIYLGNESEWLRRSVTFPVGAECLCLSFDGVLKRWVGQYLLRTKEGYFENDWFCEPGGGRTIGHLHTTYKRHDYCFSAGTVVAYWKKVGDEEARTLRYTWTPEDPWKDLGRALKANAELDRVGTVPPDQREKHGVWGRVIYPGGKGYGEKLVKFQGLLPLDGEDESVTTDKDGRFHLRVLQRVASAEFTGESRVRAWKGEHHRAFGFLEIVIRER